MAPGVSARRPVVKGSVHVCAPASDPPAGMVNRVPALGVKVNYVEFLALTFVSIARLCLHPASKLCK